MTDRRRRDRDDVGLLVCSVVGRRSGQNGCTGRTENGDAPLGRRRNDVPLAVDAEVVCGDVARRVGDVHARAVVRVSADLQPTTLRVERKVCDIDVARRPKNAARLPMQQTVPVEQHADTIEVWHQFVGSVSTHQAQHC